MEEERKRKEREHLETLAAYEGLTVEEYLAEQERKKKEAQLERERRIQKQMEEAQLQREKQIQKEKEDVARKQEEARQKRMLCDAHQEYRKPTEEYYQSYSRRLPNKT